MRLTLGAGAAVLVLILVGTALVNGTGKQSTSVAGAIKPASTTIAAGAVLPFAPVRYVAYVSAEPSVLMQPALDTQTLPLRSMAMPYGVVMVLPSAEPCVGSVSR